MQHASWLKKLALGLAFAFMASAFFIPITSSAAAPPPLLVNNGCPNVNGIPQPNCGKLGTLGRIAVQATAMNYQGFNSPSESPEVCRSVINNDAKSYFVPWKNALEWGAFLKWAEAEAALPSPRVLVKKCCLPRKADPVCDGINGVYYPCTTAPGEPNCHTLPSKGVDDNLGRRIVGVRVPDPVPGRTKAASTPPVVPPTLINYGAEGDVFIADAGTLFPGVDYKVTYTCNDGSWNKSFETGSCIPNTAQCSALNGTVLQSGSVLTNANPVNTFCAPANTMSGLTDNGATYSWVCTGTTGAAANCTATKYIAPNNGTCGTAQGGRLAAIPSSQSDLCAAGTPTIVSGDGTQTSPWVWVCQGAYGGNSSEYCSAYLQGTPFNGICGWADKRADEDPYWNPPAEAFCEYGAFTVEKTGNLWRWVCAGTDGGSDANCSATLRQVNGQCSVLNTYITNRAPNHNPPRASDLPNNGCSSGVPVNITYSATTQTLSWYCQGANGGTDSTCAATVDTTLVYGRCSWGNGSTLDVLPAFNRDTLCSHNGGEPINIVATGTPVTALSWTCQGNPPGIYDVACNVKIAQPVVRQGVCGDINGSLLSAVPTYELCDVGDPTAVAGGSTGPWSWSCSGVNGGAAVTCGATYVAPQPPPVVDGVCGGANGVADSNTPTARCNSGNATGVTVVGSNWNWQCTGSNEGTTATCTAPRIVYTAGCGTTNGTRVPGQPNQNLCLTGNANSTPIGSQTVGWDWTCSAGGNTVSCHADPCDACSGSVVQSFERALLNQTITYGGGTCAVAGLVTGTMTDGLFVSNATYTLGLKNANGTLTYSKTQVPDAAPSNYCSPCYRIPTAVSGTFKVKRQANGSCNTGTPLDTVGTEVTIEIAPPASVTFSQ
jgi:hypothetical protein